MAKQIALTESSLSAKEQRLKELKLPYEYIGSWLWVGGDPSLHKAELEQMGFRFSVVKMKWYFHEGKYEKKSKYIYTYDQLKGMFGKSN